MVAILDKILRAGEGRVVKDLQKAAKKVNEFESAIVGLSSTKIMGEPCVKYRFFETQLNAPTKF